jgi:4'-phosphopantetheinyl transferase
MILSNIDSLLRQPDVQVWPVRLAAPAEVNYAYRALLSREEAARADRFAFENLRRSYELSQGALRLLLSYYLDCRPGDVEFTIGPRGKPALRGDSRIRFNMAHSGGLALYAFTADCEIGLDVEAMRSIPEIEQIASHYFCRAEASELLSIEDAATRQEAFFRCWTRKEAYIKAVGEGLYLPLDQFQVTLSPTDPAQLVHIGNDVSAARKWTLQHLDPAPGFIGALAYQSEARQVVMSEPLETQALLAACV